MGAADIAALTISLSPYAQISTFTALDCLSNRSVLILHILSILVK
jgi:hypothetical protein